MLTSTVFKMDRNVLRRYLRLLGAAELLTCIVEASHGACLGSVVGPLCRGDLSLCTCKGVISVLLCSVESSLCLLKGNLGAGNSLVDLQGAQIQLSEE